MLFKHSQLAIMGCSNLSYYLISWTVFYVESATQFESVCDYILEYFYNDALSPIKKTVL